MGMTCFHVCNMSGMIQIRNVPDALHRRLKSRAALAGMSLSDYLLNEIRELADIASRHIRIETDVRCHIGNRVV